MVKNREASVVGSRAFLPLLTLPKAIYAISTAFIAAFVTSAMSVAVKFCWRKALSIMIGKAARIERLSLVLCLR